VHQKHYVGEQDNLLLGHLRSPSQVTRLCREKRKQKQTENNGVSLPQMIVCIPMAKDLQQSDPGAISHCGSNREAQMVHFRVRIIWPDAAKPSSY